MSRNPDLAAVFRVLDDMISKHVISDYAVGGAVASIFYVEPRDTFDLDIFFILSGEPSSALRRLEAIYEYAHRNGYETDAEFIRIHDWAVQFLEASSPLWIDAVRTANELEFEGVRASVIKPEYLAMMMVETGRPKDWLRLADFVENDVLDMGHFEELLRQYVFLDKWNAEKWRVLSDANRRN